MKAIVDGVFAVLNPPTIARDLARSRSELTKIDVEIARLTEAIATGGHMSSLLEALKARQERRTLLTAEITAHAAMDGTTLDRRTLEERARRRFMQ